MPSINARAAIFAGLVAGLVFLVLEMLLVATMGGGSPWGPPRMIGAILLGEAVLPPPATFDLLVVMVAMVIHFALSVLLGLLFGFLAEAAKLRLAAAAAFGIAFGLLVYVVNFYGMTAFFPWFAMARNGISIFAHGVFGLVLGYAYRQFSPLPEGQPQA